MSLVRMGMEGSQLYLYEDNEKRLHCCMCRLGPPDFSSATGPEMLEHIKKHREAGHRAPEWLEETLRWYTEAAG